MNVQKRPVDREIEDDKLVQKFAIGVYNKEESRKFLPKDWKLIAEYSNDNGFHGEAYEKDGKVIIAFRGTDEIKDLRTTDRQMLMREIPNQTDSALHLYYQVEKYCKEHNIDKSNITITGHSLGGSLGEIVGPTVGIKTVTFNAYGVKDIAEKYRVLKGGNENYVKNYGDVNDAVFYSRMHNHVGKTYVLDNDKENKTPNLSKYHKAETIQNLEDAEPYDIHKHHKFEKESMSKDRVLVVEDVIRRKDWGQNSYFANYFLNQARKGYTMWEREIDKKVSGGEVYVHSYTRDDGTKVRDYYRSYPHK